MMRIRSLKRRLFLAFFPSMVLIVTAVVWVAHHEMETILYSHVDRIVQAKCHAVMSILNAVSEAHEQQRSIANILDTNSGQDTSLYWLWATQEQVVVMANTSLDETVLPWLEQADNHTSFSSVQEPPCTRDINGSEYRLVQRSVSVGQKPSTLFIAYPSQSLHDQLHQFLWFLMGTGTLVVLVAITLVMGTVSWALRPVNQAANLLQNVSGADTSMTDINRLNVPSELTAFKTALAGMLDRLNLFVDRQKQFTANAAHELRTPITLAKSTVQTAFYQRTETDHCQKALTDILSDLDRMAGLIDQLQRLSNLDETEELFDTSLFSLDGLLQEITQASDQTAPGRVVLVSDHSVSVEGNKELIHCMLSNLVDNALVHGPEDCPVSIQVQPPSGDEFVCVEIKDEGGEISKEDVSRLTERFYRADSSRGRDTGGSGLGLAIANEIVKKHKGQLIIQSSLAAGTCVRVKLPASMP